MKRKRRSNEPTCLCGGVGYLQRVTDNALVKCPWCDGTGKKPEPEATDGG